MNRFAYTRFWTVLGISLIVAAGNLKAEDPWVIYEGKEGPGKGAYGPENDGSASPQPDP